MYTYCNHCHIRLGSQERRIIDDNKVFHLACRPRYDNMRPMRRFVPDRYAIDDPFGYSPEDVIGGRSEE